MEFRLLVERGHRRKSANALLAIVLIAAASLALEYLAGWSLGEMLQSALTFAIVLIAAATRFKTRKGEAERLWITAAWGRLVGLAETLLERIDRRHEVAPDGLSGAAEAEESGARDPRIPGPDRPRLAATGRSTPSGEFSVDDVGYD